MRQVIGDAIQDVAETAGQFAGPDHVHIERAEDARVGGDGLAERLAGLDVGVQLHEELPQLHVVGLLGHRLKGLGDADAAKYYKMLEADPELAMFLRDIEALKIMLKQDTTIVLGADTQPIGLLKDVPDITPKSAE